MEWAGSALVACWRPAISSFLRPSIFRRLANPFRFIALRTLAPDGNSLPFSFQQVTHSLPSHGTGALSSPQSCSPITPLFVTLADSTSRKPFVCHSYANTGVTPNASHFGTQQSAVESSRGIPPAHEHPCISIFGFRSSSFRFAATALPGSPGFPATAAAACYAAALSSAAGWISA